MQNENLKKIGLVSLLSVAVITALVASDSNKTIKGTLADGSPWEGKSVVMSQDELDNYTYGQIIKGCYPIIDLCDSKCGTKDPDLSEISPECISDVIPRVSSVEEKNNSDIRILKKLLVTDTEIKENITIKDGKYILDTFKIVREKVEEAGHVIEESKVE